jgi:hypothetical protein
MIDYALHEFPQSVNLKQAIEQGKHIDVVYGFFTGGDPRDFKPDFECCTADEITRWKEACQKWNDGEQLNCPGSHINITDDDGKLIGFCTKATFGIGVYLYVWDEEEETA